MHLSKPDYLAYCKWLFEIPKPYLTGEKLLSLSTCHHRGVNYPETKDFEVFSQKEI
jgi:hypothetical protein